MITIRKDKPIQIRWEIFKQPNVHEDFCRADYALFLINDSDRFSVPVEAIAGVLYSTLNEGLPSGTYTVEAIWIKNKNRGICCHHDIEHHHHDCHEPHMGHHDFHHNEDYRFDASNIMKAKYDYAFRISDDYCTDNTGSTGIALVPLKSNVASYGYDGLDAYQLAILEHRFVGSESNWFEYITNGHGTFNFDMNAFSAIAEVSYSNEPTANIEYKNGIFKFKFGLPQYNNSTPVQIDLSNYYTKSEVNNKFVLKGSASGGGTVDLSEVNKKIETLNTTIESTKKGIDDKWQEWLNNLDPKSLGILNYLASAYWDEDGNLKTASGTILTSNVNQAVAQLRAQYKKDYTEIKSLLTLSSDDIRALGELAASFKDSDGEFDIKTMILAYADAKGSAADIEAKYFENGQLKTTAGVNVKNSVENAIANMFVKYFIKDADGNFSLKSTAGLVQSTDANYAKLNTLSQFVDSNGKVNYSGLNLSASDTQSLAELIADYITITGEQIDIDAIVTNIKGKLNTENLIVNNGAAQFNSDKTGSLAGGNISWDSEGHLSYVESIYNTTTYGTNNWDVSKFKVAVINGGHFDLTVNNSPKPGEILTVINGNSSRSQNVYINFNNAPLVLAKTYYTNKCHIGTLSTIRFMYVQVTTNNFIYVPLDSLTVVGGGQGVGNMATCFTNNLVEYKGEYLYTNVNE